MAKRKKAAASRARGPQRLGAIPAVKGAAQQAGITLANADRLVSSLRDLLAQVSAGNLQVEIQIPVGTRIIINPKVIKPPT